jgi:Tol biopolymer transport system component
MVRSIAIMFALVISNWSLSAAIASPLLISKAYESGVTAAGNSSAPVLSGDGRFVVFVSHARNLTTNHFSELALNVFRHDLASGETLLVSCDSTGTTGGDDNSAGYAISGDGRYVAFSSAAGNLVATDTNRAMDIFLRDTLNNTTRLVTVDITTGRTPFNNSPSSTKLLSSNPQISIDGRWVIFESKSRTLVDVPETMGILAVFARDMISNKTCLVSISLNGMAPSTEAYLPRISPDGRFVCFVSAATNLVEIGTPQQENLFLRDLEQNKTTWISTNSQQLPSDPYRVVDHAMSWDGAVIALKVLPAGSRTAWVYRYGQDSSSARLLTTNSHPRSSPQLSADGRLLAYDSGTNVLIWDAMLETNILVNLDNSNTRAANGMSHTPVLSADGRAVAFLSNAGDLAVGWNNGQFQVFQRDIASNITVLASANTNGSGANANHELVPPTITTNGSALAFESTASDLLLNDLNKASDVFVFDSSSSPALKCGSLHEMTKPSLTGPGLSGTGRNSASAEGTVISFSSSDGTLVTDDANSWIDVFARDAQSGANSLISVTVMPAYDAEITPDGRFVTYTRRLDPYVSSYHEDVWRFDRREKTTTQVSDGEGPSYILSPTSHSITSNGRFVTFQTVDDLVWFDDNFRSDVYMRDLADESITLISGGDDGWAAGGISPTFAPDDQHVFFFNTSTQLMVKLIGDTGSPVLVSHSQDNSNYSSFGPIRSFNISGNSQRVVFGVTGSNPQLYLNDLASNSVRSFCDNCQNGSLNGDGTLLAYESKQSGNSRREVYLYDSLAGQSTLLSAPERLSFPTDTPLDSFSPLTSRDGRFVIFLSHVATNVTDPVRLYSYDRFINQTMLLTPGADGLTGNPQLQFARNARTLVFSSFSSDIVEDDYNDKRDVFTLRLGSGDQDRDGLDDDWELAYFNALSRDGYADFDGDGRNDLEEFRSGTDPTNPSSVLRVLELSRAAGLTTVSWNANPGRSYIVEFNNTLDATDWSTVVGEVRFAGSIASITDQTLFTSAQRFYRIAALP